MQRRDFLKIGVGAVALTTALKTDAAAPKRSNVLFILADDLKADCIGALGNPHIKTPNLDRLVQRGFVFPRTYCFGSMVGAVCLPSRSMIVTGRSLFHLPAEKILRGNFKQYQAAMVGRKEGRDWVLLPHVLREAGYETYHIGKSGNGFVPGLQAFEHNTIRDDRSIEERANSSQNHADQIIEFLRTRQADRPFLVYTHINKTQLFDLQIDSRETNDLADKPEHAGKVEEMMALLAKAQKQWGDTCPLVSPSPASPEWTPPAKERPSAARRTRRSTTE
jgi:arylsulfatase A-like enzyme